MTMVWITALGVGGATMVGALLGLVFKKLPHRFSDILLSFAAGIMMAAAVLGLILPSVEYGGGKAGLPEAAVQVAQILQLGGADKGEVGGIEEEYRPFSQNVLPGHRFEITVGIGPQVKFGHFPVNERHSDRSFDQIWSYFPHFPEVLYYPSSTSEISMTQNPTSRA